MNTKYSGGVSSKNSERLLKNLKKYDRGLLFFAALCSIHPGLYILTVTESRSVHQLQSLCKKFHVSLDVICDLFSMFRWQIPSIATPIGVLWYVYQGVGKAESMLG